MGARRPNHCTAIGQAEGRAGGEEGRDQSGSQINRLRDAQARARQAREALHAPGGAARQKQHKQVLSWTTQFICVTAHVRLQAQHTQHVENQVLGLGKSHDQCPAHLRPPPGAAPWPRWRPWCHSSHRRGERGVPGRRGRTARPAESLLSTASRLEIRNELAQIVTCKHHAARPAGSLPSTARQVGNQ